MGLACHRARRTRLANRCGIARLIGRGCGNVRNRYASFPFADLCGCLNDGQVDIGRNTIAYDRYVKSVAKYGGIRPCIAAAILSSY